MRKYRLYFKIYTFLLHNPVTRTLTSQIQRRYEFICPARETYIVEKTVTTLLLTWFVVLAEIICIIRFHPSLVQTMIAAMIAVILHHEIISYLLCRLEEKILRQFEQFITDVRHYYYVSQMVDEAILDSLDHTAYEMRVHAQKFYDIITSDHYEELTEQYCLSTHNNYFHLFLALCITVLEYGDRTIRNQSLFHMNLSNLKTEVNIEILKLRQLNYLYAGLTFVILTPMTLLKVIEHWAVSNLSELASFYHSGIGYITAFLIIISSLIIYVVVGELKDYRASLPKYHILLEQFLKHRRVEKCMINYSNRFSNRMKHLQKLIDDSFEPIQLKEVVGMKLLNASCGALVVFIISMIYLIKNHSRYDWYEFVFMILVGWLCFYLPELRLLFHKRLAVIIREDEMIQYQSIVLMLMYIERISVLEILERIEDFSYIFRKPIQNCINNYNALDKVALERMKEEANFIPFQRFVDNLLISDEIGIERAFDEVASERQYFQEKRKQENEMNLKQRYELSKFIAYIPAILVIGGYLILPFLIECYRQLREYREMMNMLF